MDVLLGIKKPQPSSQPPPPPVAKAGRLLDTCKPRTSLGVLYSDTEVLSLRAWLASGACGPALATASPGSGLTTLVHLLVGELGLDTVWIGCGTPRIRALLEQAGANPLSVTMRRKVVIIDEFDALSSGDTMATSDVLSFVRGKPPVPILVLSHSTRSAKSLEFAKAWPKFAFGRPGMATMTAYLRTTATKHGVEISDQDVEALAKQVRGDVRAALMALELRRRGGAEIHTKDEATEGLDLTEAVLRGERGHTVRDCLRMFGMESAVVPMGIYENYLASLGKDDMRAATEAAEAFAEADVVDRYIYARQSWDTYEVYGVFSVAAPCMALRHYRRSKPSPTFGVTKFGSVWSKVYNMCAKTKHIKTLAFRYAEAGLSPLSACDLAWVRRCLRAATDRSSDVAADEDIKRITWPLTAADVLALARLDTGGSAWYKQATHARVKRVLDARC